MYANIFLSSVDILKCTPSHKQNVLLGVHVPQVGNPCLRSFALFIAPDGIAGFGIVLVRHCNLVSALSFYESTD